jgi:hypothetical protein
MTVAMLFNGLISWMLAEPFSEPQKGKGNFVVPNLTYTIRVT